MAVLESDYRWLEFSDHQYLAPAERPTPDEVAPVLDATIAELDPTSVFFPMGLANPDHVMVHDACLECASVSPGSGVVLLRGPRVQAPARDCWPGVWRSSCGAGRGRRRPSSPTCPTRIASAGPSGATRSQIAPLERDHALSARLEARVPEQFWRLAPPPDGWDGLADLI